MCALNTFQNATASTPQSNDDMMKNNGHSLFETDHSTFCMRNRDFEKFCRFGKFMHGSYAEASNQMCERKLLHKPEEGMQQHLVHRYTKCNDRIFM